MFITWLQQKFKYFLNHRLKTATTVILIMEKIEFLLLEWLEKWRLEVELELSKNWSSCIYREVVQNIIFIFYKYHQNKLSYELRKIVCDIREDCPQEKFPLSCFFIITFIKRCFLVHLIMILVQAFSRGNSYKSYLSTYL